LDSIQQTDTQSYKSTSETTKHPSSNIIDINKSKICFEIGDITDTKVIGLGFIFRKQFSISNIINYLIKGRCNCKCNKSGVEFA